jgi:hypothetical protein
VVDQKLREEKETHRKKILNENKSNCRNVEKERRRGKE